MSVLNNIDFYKADHRSQYPKGTTLVMSNWTPRMTRISGIDHVVLFGLQYYIKEYLINQWNKTFFNVPLDLVLLDYKRRMKTSMINIQYDHIEALHKLGYLPIQIDAIPEGASVPIGCPMFTIRNTHPDFFWLTNYLETSLSNTIWSACTSATIAKKYKEIFTKYAELSGGAKDFIPFQGHDFSYRGISSQESAAVSGAGHLLSFVGTDTIPAIDFLERYYGVDAETELVGCSVPATEHSVMCMGSKESEFDTYKRLITEVYPHGIVSIVSDTWDYWKVWTEILPALKADILARSENSPIPDPFNKVVIRPDSGDPVKIICGDAEAEVGSPAYKGSFELAWELFGGTVNEKGFKVLDSHIGLIYGDSITLDRAEAICKQLTDKGFVPNLVLGIGSYTYQYVTRDTFGFAIKSTYGEIDGVAREIFKDPATDNGTKKSAKGIPAVFKDDAGKYYLSDQASWDTYLTCEFEPVFKDGVMTKFHSLRDIRSTIDG